jgi:hypothetical protein
MDSVDGSRASDLLGSPSETPRLLSQSHPSCRSHHGPRVLGTSDLVGDDEVLGTATTM